MRNFPLNELDAGAGAAGDTGASTEQTSANLNVAGAYTDIPEKYAQDPAFQGYKSTDDIYNEFKTLKSIHGADPSSILRMPGEDATPEQIQEFYSKLGKPASAAEYELARPEDLPQGLDYSDEMAAEFAQLAYDTNLPKEATKKIFEWYHNKVKGAFEAERQNSEAAREQLLADNMNELEKAWGGSHESPEFAVHMKNAQRAFNYGATPEVAQVFKDDPALASNPHVLKLLAGLGAKMNADTVPTVTGGLQVGSFPDTVSGIEAKIQEFKDSGKFKEMVTDGSPKAKALSAEWRMLNEKLRQSMGAQ